MNLANRLSVTLAALAALGLAALPSQAGTTTQSIGIKLAADGNTTLAPSESAGAFSQVNWNNFGGSTGSSSILNDSSGTLVSGATLAYSGPYTFSGIPVTSDSNTKLLSTRVETNDGAKAVSVTVSGLSFAKYDVYAYFGSDGGGRFGNVGIVGGTTYYYQTVGNPNGAYSLTTSTVSTDPRPASDYAIFSGLTASSFTLKQFREGSNSGIFGLQVVNTSPVPEASQGAVFGLCLLGLTGVALKARKRKAGTTTA